jgi:hypothetical protein
MSEARHDFVIVIPVADRPRHLADCLDSLTELRRHYPYPGEVRVLIADDSREEANRARHRAIAEDHARAGLATHYLGQDAQRALVEALPADIRARLSGVVGAGASYAHKGASITRNIACLWLARLPADGRKRLFWFLDSDQEFRVNVETGAGEAEPYAVDYLHGLDRIFSETPVQVLTGKVVGDPPVSPAVMAGNFLDDVLAFVVEMDALVGAAECGFHGAVRPADDAAYHDMADLFGFQSAARAWRYRCQIEGRHDHAACLAGFAARLERFFDGEHPTRRSYYQAGDVMAGIKPARTLYTGNYVVTPEGLDWFIPFAALKLRMAGPTLGRIMRAELGAAFVSANLPMLHRRTVAETGRAECRPGVEQGDGRVDLSGEFERQFYGDVMLFAVERLAGQGFPHECPDPVGLAATVAAVEAELRERYRARQAETSARIERLAARFGNPAAWWQQAVGLAGARADCERFIANLRDNFSEAAPAWRLIDSEAHRAERLAAIVAAIAGYGDDRAAWRAVLARST